MLDPDRLSTDPLLDQTGVVIPVAPFGRPVGQLPWVAFRARTGVPVAIAGAATFDRLATSAGFLGEIPEALSFHATKSFGVGEGGGVATKDLNLALRVAQALNFGFHGSRDSAIASINGKMSEYHAAVGLAELDSWPQKSATLQSVVNTYRFNLIRNDLVDRLISAPDISSSYALFRCFDHSEGELVMEAPNRAQVEFRLWYGRGVHHQTHYLERTRATFPIIQDLLQCLVGIPIAPDLKFSKSVA